MRILVIEDDHEQLSPLEQALTLSGHIVDGVLDGESAEWLFSEKDYDLLIIDWMLPGISGLEVCKQYRQMGKTSPVIFLTAKNSVKSKLEALELGADDYLVKPIDLYELLARIKAFGRRSTFWQGDILRLGDLSLNLNTMQVERGKNTIELNLKEFQLLEYFLHNPDCVLSRQQIERSLWSQSLEPKSNALSVLVNRLRDRLKQINAHTWIDTIRGRGYRISMK